MTFIQGGQTPYEVLFAATKGGATALSLQGVGELAVGNLADLVIYPKDQNPLNNLTYVRSLTHVMKGGRLFLSPSLAQLYPDVADPPVPPVSNTPVSPQFNAA